MKIFAGTVALMCVAANFLSAQIISPDTNLTAREQQIVAASKIQSAPQFNGAKIVGVRPNTPLIFSLAVNGKLPIKFSAKNLPHGLKLDSGTGILTGSLKKPGAYKFKVFAKNSSGNAETEIKIVCGDKLALTPPMGWNSYDAFGDSVRESEVLSNAIWLKKNLQAFGWDTVVVDFRWYDRLAHGQPGQNPEGVTIDNFGRCIPPTNRFPSAANGAGFKNLADQIHAMGLKFGIHIMRGIPRKAVEENLPIAGSKFTAAQAILPVGDINRECVWNHDMFGVDATTAAGKAWYASIAKQYAAWGVDYIKCDDIANLQRGRFYDASEIEVLSDALKNSGRSIILSLSPGATPLNAAPHVEKFANLWRISGDFWDNWRSLNNNFDLFAEWFGSGAPGHWPDGDMIPFGHICQRNCDVHPDRWTNFTRDEQLTLMSLWALAPSPLMLGANLPDNDAWTTAILSNPEVLAVNQDSLGLEARRMFGPPQIAETWMKKLSDGSFAVGFFNRTDKTISVNFPWRNLGFLSAPEVRDLWLRKNLGRQENFVAELPPHGSILLKLK
ncbi:MAG: putative Ig domain-containing protein [Limisphaerales bacterium]